MNRFFALCCCVLLLQGAVAADFQGPQGRDWLMVVVSNNKDPTREAEFNYWYDDIDLPDVFTVPGYMRARRAQGQYVPEYPSADLQPDEGKYIALYDIASDDIDGTIINMLLLARKMDSTGRSTDLLEVTERLYFRRYGPAVEAPKPKETGAKAFLYVVKVDCCRRADDRAGFNDWYDRVLMPALLDAEGMISATRYQLHRVVMTEPILTPDYLTVFEIEAASAADAMKHFQGAIGNVRSGRRWNDLYKETGATVYLKIKDIERP